jgi:beta-barrel assembly-enhancing protease
MKKIVLQGLLMVALFMGVFWGLSLVDWMGLFKVEKIKKASDEKLGRVFWDIVRETEREEKDSVLVQPVQQMLQHLVRSNGLDSTHFHLHLIRHKEVNAFALPGGHLVVHTGLLKNVKSEAELAGVLSHEMAHVTLDHVMKTLVKEIGVSTLTAITTGGGELAREAVQYLGSAAFSRQLEAAADAQAVAYVTKAKMDPMAMADFLLRMSEDKADLEAYTSWLNTHPAGKERAAEIKALRGTATIQSVPVLSTQAWTKMKAAL